MRSKRHLFACLTAACAFVLLFAGGLVTSTGSSLAVPDWPLSFGKLMPPMVGGVLFEHGHRMIAGFVALLVFALAGWTAFEEKRPWVRRLSYALAGLIIVQAVLGGVTVLLRLPPSVSISHAILGQTLFLGILVIAQATSHRYHDFERAPQAVWKAALFALGALYAQLVLGAYLRHTGEGLWFHAGWAAAAALAVIVLSIKAWSLRALSGPARLAAAILPVQIFLGIVSWRLKFAPDFITGIHREAVFITAHQALGAALLGTVAVLAARARPL